MATTLGTASSQNEAGDGGITAAGEAVLTGAESSATTRQDEGYSIGYGDYSAGGDPYATENTSGKSESYSENSQYSYGAAAQADPYYSESSSYYVQDEQSPAPAPVQEHPKAAPPDNKGSGSYLRGKLSPSELSAFCTQMAMILHAGILAEEGVSIMCEDAKDSATRGILEQIRTGVSHGDPLYISLEKPGVFPRYLIDMVQVGEEAGRLEEVMDNLAGYYERDENIRRSIRSAVFYPMVMVAVMVVVIGVLVAKVLPVFAQVFEQLGGEMTGFSGQIMNFGMTAGSYAAIVIAVAVGIGIIMAIMWRTRGGRSALTRLFSVLPFTRGLFAKIASSRIASAMALMLSSGLDTDRALDMAGRLSDDPGVRKKLQACRASVTAGNSFSDALSETGIFTGVYARMVSVGFKTGSVDMVMRKLADRYSEEVDERIGHMVSMVEPTLVAVLSIIVGLILLSVMLPLMGIMSAIG